MAEWVKVSERLPDKSGPYQVIRRGLRGKSYEDVCWFTTKQGAHDAFWGNARGVLITTVEAWKDGKAD